MIGRARFAAPNELFRAVEQQVRPDVYQAQNLALSKPFWNYGKITRKYWQQFVRIAHLNRQNTEKKWTAHNIFSNKKVELERYSDDFGDTLPRFLATPVTAAAGIKSSRIQGLQLSAVLDTLAKIIKAACHTAFTRGAGISKSVLDQFVLGLRRARRKPYAPEILSGSTLLLALLYFGMVARGEPRNFQADVIAQRFAQPESQADAGLAGRCEKPSCSKSDRLGGITTNLDTPFMLAKLDAEANELLQRFHFAPAVFSLAAAHSDATTDYFVAHVGDKIAAHLAAEPVLIKAPSEVRAAVAPSVVGSAGPPAIKLLVTGLPKSISLSSGKRISASDWLLNIADLQNLDVTIPSNLNEPMEADIEAIREDGSSAGAVHLKILPEAEILDEKDDEDAKTAKKPSKSDDTPKVSKRTKSKVTVSSEPAPRKKVTGKSRRRRVVIERTPLRPKAASEPTIAEASVEKPAPAPVAKTKPVLASPAAAPGISDIGKQMLQSLGGVIGLGKAAEPPASN